MPSAQSLRRVSDGLDKLVVAVCVTLVVVMLAISTVGVMLEVTFNLFEVFDVGQAFADSPLAWFYSQTRPSMTRLFLPWVAMLGLTVAFKSGEHVAIAMLLRRLPPAAMRAVQVVNLLVVALFGVALVWYGAIFFDNSTQLFMVSDTLQVPHKWTALSVPISGFIMCVHLLSGTALVEQAEFIAEEAEK